MKIPSGNSWKTIRWYCDSCKTVGQVKHAGATRKQVLDAMRASHFDLSNGACLEPELYIAVPRESLVDERRLQNEGEEL